MTLLVMAAGMGSRFGRLKQVEPIDDNGSFLIDYSIYDAIKAGFDHVVFVIKEEHLDIFRSSIGKRIESRVKVDYAFQALSDVPVGTDIPAERTKPWGTSHAVLCCEKYINDPFICINADDFYGHESFALLHDYLKTADASAAVKPYCMAGYVLSNTLTENGHVSRGVCDANADCNLTGITERLKLQRVDGVIRDLDEGISLPDDSIVSMNMWGFTPDVFAKLREGFAAFLQRTDIDRVKAEYFLPLFIEAVTGEGYADVKVLKTDAKWYGVTYPEDKEKVVAYLSGERAAGRYPGKLF